MSERTGACASEARTLFYLGSHRWKGQRQRAHHLAAGLARTRRVVFVEPAAYSVAGALRRRSRGQSIGACRQRLHVVSDTLSVYTPAPSLPWSLQFRSLNRLVHRWAWRSLGAALGRDRFPAVDVVLAWPPALDLARLLQPRRLIYDCLDLFPAFHGGRRRRLMEDLEADLARDASAIVVTSHMLERRWEGRHPRILRIPNGVEWPMFRTSADPQPLPADLADVPRPRLGYVGTIGHWLDLPLLVQVARERPHCSIVLVGPSERGMARPPGVPNLHYLGERPYGSLPAYLAAMDVLLIPFRLMDLTHAVNPIKFYEYCASGKPIVATPLEELVRFKDACYLGDDPRSFVSAVDAAAFEASHPDPMRIADRRAIARANTWDDRVAALTTLLAELDS